MPDNRNTKRYTLRQAERLLAQIVAFAEGPGATSPRKEITRLLQDVLYVGPILFTGVPAIASWTPLDFANFQRTMQKFFRRLMDVGESGNEEAVQVPALVVEQLRIGVTTVRDDVALTVEGHEAVDVLTFQIVNLVQMVGLDRLRRCPCGRVFVKTGRREFCSDRCQKRVYMRAKRADERRERERRKHPRKKARRRD